MSNRLLVFNATGSGSWTLVHPDLPVDEVTWTDVIQSPSAVTLTLDVERDEAPYKMFTPWLTALVAEVDGEVRAFGLVTDRDAEDNKLTVNCVGLSSYPSGMPWVGADLKLYDADPGSIISLIWKKLQAQPMGNLGVTCDTAKTSIRLGVKVEEIRAPKSTPKPNLKVPSSGSGAAVSPGGPSYAPGALLRAGVDEPWLLTATEDFDLQSVLDGLYTDSSLEWREVVSWQGSQPRCHINVSARVGSRKANYLGILGLNVFEIPAIEEDPEDYASHVLVVGAGEGKKRIMHTAASAKLNRIRRVYVKQAQSVDRKDAAKKLAEKVLAKKSATPGKIRSFRMLDHPSCPVWALSPGDEIQIRGDAGQAGEITRWVRILSITSTLSEPHIREFDAFDLAADEDE